MKGQIATDLIFSLWGTWAGDFNMKPSNKVFFDAGLGASFYG